MIAIYFLALQILKLYTYIVIANVIVSWLVAFNVLNTSNRFVYMVLEFTYKLTEPILNKIRGFLPNLGSLDISPVVLLLLLWLPAQNRSTCTNRTGFNRRSQTLLMPGVVKPAPLCWPHRGTQPAPCLIKPI